MVLEFHELDTENIGTKRALHGRCLWQHRLVVKQLKMCVEPGSNQKAGSTLQNVGKLSLVPEQLGKKQRLMLYATCEGLGKKTIGCQTQIQRCEKRYSKSCYTRRERRERNQYELVIDKKLEHEGHQKLGPNFCSWACMLHTVSPQLGEGVSREHLLVSV